MTDAEIQQVADEASKLLAMAIREPKAFEAYGSRAILVIADLVKISNHMKERMKHEDD